MQQYVRVDDKAFSVADQGDTNRCVHSPIQHATITRQFMLGRPKLCASRLYSVSVPGWVWLLTASALFDRR